MNGAAGDAELTRKVEEYRARERIYLAGLIEQEAGINRLRRTAADVSGAYGDVSRAAVRGALVDPTANMELMALRQKAHEKDRQIKELQEELDAGRFDQRSPSGLVLMRKCRALLEENKDLGEQIREDKAAELRAALQAEQQANAQAQQRCTEASDFCKELTQENDKLLGTISQVAGKLFEVKAELEVVKQEKLEYKNKRKREKADAKAVQAAAAAQDTLEGIAAGGEEALMALASAASLGGESALFAAVAARAEPDSEAAAPVVDLDEQSPKDEEEEQVEEKKEKKEKKRKRRKLE